MKKRVISFLLSLIFIFTSAFCLVSCKPENKFTVTFNMGTQYANIRLAKGYEDIPLVQTVSSYKELVEPLFVCDEAYHIGWNDILKNISKTTTLTAAWSNKPLVVEFEPGAVDAVWENGNETVVTNAPASITPPEYSRPGYTLDETWGGINFEALKENITITANWLPNNYNIIFQEADGQNPTFSGDNNLQLNQENRYYKQVTFGEEIGSLPTPIPSGNKKFAGWLLNGTSTGVTSQCVFETPSDAILDAVWLNSNQYALIYENVGLVDNPIFYTLNQTTFKLNKPTKKGYDFIGWTYAGQTTPQQEVYIDTTISDQQVFTAHWQVKTFTISLDALSGGVVDKANVLVSYGQRIGELPIATRDGYDFVGWTTNNKTEVTKNTVWNIDDPSIKLVAKYKRIYTVKFVLKGETEGVMVNCRLVPKSYEGYTLIQSEMEEDTYIWENVREDTRIDNLPSAVAINSEEYKFRSWKYRSSPTSKKTITVKPGLVFCEANFPGSYESGVIVIYAYSFNKWSPFF